MITVRDEAIQITVSNLISAGVLLPEETRHFIADLDALNDINLGLRMVESRHLADLALALSAHQSRN